jgi:hypothetical protein
MKTDNLPQVVRHKDILYHVCQQRDVANNQPPENGN